MYLKQSLLILSLAFGATHFMTHPINDQSNSSKKGIYATSAISAIGTVATIIYFETQYGIFEKIGNKAKNIWQWMNFRKTNCSDSSYLYEDGGILNELDKLEAELIIADLKIDSESYKQKNDNLKEYCSSLYKKNAGLGTSPEDIEKAQENDAIIAKMRKSIECYNQQLDSIEKKKSKLYANILNYEEMLPSLSDEIIEE